MGPLRRASVGASFPVSHHRTPDELALAPHGDRFWRSGHFCAARCLSHARWICSACADGGHRVFHPSQMGRQAGVPARPGARFLAALGEKRNRPHVPADVDLALPVLVGCFTRALGALVLSVLMNRFSEPTPPLPRPPAPPPPRRAGGGGGGGGRVPLLPWREKGWG